MMMMQGAVFLVDAFHCDTRRRARCLVGQIEYGGGGNGGVDSKVECVCRVSTGCSYYLLPLSANGVGREKILDENTINLDKQNLQPAR